MHLLQTALHTRRAFLRRASQLAMTGAALPMAMNLAAMSEAAAFEATDYKALVCVFLSGGSDHANTVVTYDDPSYNIYHTVRGGEPNQAAGGIALAKSSLSATLLTPTTAVPAIEADYATKHGTRGVAPSPFSYPFNLTQLTTAGSRGNGRL